mmetsp:Transcript_43913/g.73137  ORF Transcript_43913/g.73137 Transcript_43913/m.73137 type:complete len:290 (-) Transcript_43913:174-1043(-)
MLVGFPGSGKSTFRNELLKLNDLDWSEKKWNVVSQDEVKSRRTCEDLIGRLAKDRKNRVILDRCNPEARDRKYWLGLAWKPKDSTAVFFNTPIETCISRMQKRHNHPTIKQGTHLSKLQRIMTGFKKKFEVPTTKEGFRRVHTITTPAHAAKLLHDWGCDSESLSWMRQVPGEQNDGGEEDQNGEGDAAPVTSEQYSMMGGGSNDDSESKADIVDDEAAEMARIVRNDGDGVNDKSSRIRKNGLEKRRDGRRTGERKNRSKEKSISAKNDRTSPSSGRRRRKESRGKKK